MLNPVVGVKSVTGSSSAGNLMARFESDPEHLSCGIPCNALVTLLDSVIASIHQQKFNVLEVDKSVPKLNV